MAPGSGMVVPASAVADPVVIIVIPEVKATGRSSPAIVTVDPVTLIAAPG